MVFPLLWPVVPVRAPVVPVLQVSAHNGQICGDLFKGVFFPNGSYLLSLFLPPLLTFFELANSQSLHGFLLVFEEKERGDLDPHFHQSLSPLCEGNPLDLDLGVLGVLLLVLPLIFLPSISCFGGI